MFFLYICDTQIITVVLNPNGNLLKTNTRALSDPLEKLQGPDLAPRKARYEVSNGAPTRLWQFIRTSSSSSSSSSLCLLVLGHN